MNINQLSEILKKKILIHKIVKKVEVEDKSFFIESMNQAKLENSI